MPADETHNDDLPDEFVAALKDQHRSEPLITSRVDREVARQSQAHFRERVEPRRRRTPIRIAAAASVLVAVLLVQTQDQSRNAPAALFSDVDNSGQIDIADVLALARHNKSVAQEDLDAFARRLVTLNIVADAS